MLRRVVAHRWAAASACSYIMLMTWSGATFSTPRRLQMLLGARQGLRTLAKRRTDLRLHARPEHLNSTQKRSAPFNRAVLSLLTYCRHN